MLSGKVDATLGAFWNYEGVDLAAPRPQAGDPAHGEARRADLRRARLRRAPAATSTRTSAPRLRRFMQATARGHAALQGRPRGRARRAAGGRQGPRPRAAGRPRSRRRCRCSSPPDASGPSATRTRTSGSATPTGCSTTGLIKRRQTAEQALTNEFLAGRGARPGDDLAGLTGSRPRAAARRRYSPASPFHSP